MATVADAHPQVRTVLWSALLVWIVAGQSLFALAGDATLPVLIPAYVVGAAVFPGPIAYAIAHREESYSVSTLVGLIPAGSIAAVIGTQIALGGLGGTGFVLLALYSVILCVAVGLVSTTIGHGVGVHRR